MSFCACKNYEIKNKAKMSSDDFTFVITLIIFLKFLKRLLFVGLSGQVLKLFDSF